MGVTVGRLMGLTVGLGFRLDFLLVDLLLLIQSDFFELLLLDFDSQSCHHQPSSRPLRSSADLDSKDLDLLKIVFFVPTKRFLELLPPTSKRFLDLLPPTSTRFLDLLPPTSSSFLDLLPPLDVAQVGKVTGVDVGRFTGRIQRKSCSLSGGTASRNDDLRGMLGCCSSPRGGGVAETDVASKSRMIMRGIVIIFL